MVLLCVPLLFSSFLFFFFKQKTAYEMRISDWSSDVCSSDLPSATHLAVSFLAISTSCGKSTSAHSSPSIDTVPISRSMASISIARKYQRSTPSGVRIIFSTWLRKIEGPSPRKRSEEHTSELQSLMRLSSAVLCVKKKKSKH